MSNLTQTMMKSKCIADVSNLRREITLLALLSAKRQKSKIVQYHDNNENPLLDFVIASKTFHDFYDLQLDKQFETDVNH